MDDTLHYLIMANHMLVQRALLEQLRDTGLTIGQPKILDYLKDHDGSSQKDIAKACFLEAGSLTTILNKMEEKGLIEDARLFVVQELLSAYHGEILPGIYDLSTSMTAEEMLAVMSTPAEESKEEDDDVGESVEENEDIENTEGMTAE